MQAKDFGEILKKLRKDKGLTQKDVARLLDLSVSKQIERYEKGELFPDVAKLYSLSEIFETDLFSLLSKGPVGTADEKLDQVIASLGKISEKLSTVEKKLDLSTGAVKGPSNSPGS